MFCALFCRLFRSARAPAHSVLINLTIPLYFVFPLPHRSNQQVHLHPSASGVPAAAAGTFGAAAVDGAERARPADGSPGQVPGTGVDVATDAAAAGIDRARRGRPPADGSRVGVLLPPPEEGRRLRLAVTGVRVLRSNGPRLEFRTSPRIALIPSFPRPSEHSAL